MPRAGQRKKVRFRKSRSQKTRTSIDFDIVRKIGLALPGVQASSAYGSVALKVNGKLLACEATNRSAEPGSLVVRVNPEDRAQLIAEAPDVYYVTDHYVPYSAVLVRLPRVNSDVLRDLLHMAHRFVTRNAPLLSPKGKH
ncbi:MAG TPA: MmcQ/YjbR family DNA-binding protein [Candidatus Acidoferrales bacterium]|nr:MmcQ/YjbR family DNA-binding protein [Candidatus Acidoferrales bacterium]